MPNEFLCRTCAETIFNSTGKKIFDEDDNEILQNIEKLTGMRLNDDERLPQYICNCCHLDLYHSITFRERCIYAQSVLQRVRPNNTTGQPIQNTSKQLKIQTKQKPNPVTKEKLNESRTLDIVTDPSPEVEISSHQRILRTRSKNSSTPVKNLSIKRRRRSRDSLTDLPPIETDNNYENPSLQLVNLEQPEATISEIPDEIYNESREELFSPAASVDFITSSEQQGDKVSNTKKEKRLEKPTANNKVYICDICGHQSCSQKNLDIHIMRHKGEKNYECEECGARHYTKYLLKLHIRIKHRGEAPFVCRYCGQSFFSGSERVRHEKVNHIRDFNYSCKVCGKKYITKSCLNKHEFLHTGLRPYRCDLCNVAFPRNPGLKIHLRTKQHQKRAAEALNDENNVTVIKEILIQNDEIVFTDGNTIIEVIDEQNNCTELLST